MTSSKKISFLPNNSEMSQLIQQKDWSKTPIGSPDTWSQSLRTTLSIMLNSKFPMFLFWGPDHICFYNDAYRPSLGNDGKHPTILGIPANEGWKETWYHIKPLIDRVLAGGEANWSEDQLLPIFRNNTVEDVYWTFSYSAVNDESGKPAGVFVTCMETTKKVNALKKLEESQEKFKLAIDAAGLGAWDLNPKTNTFTFNEKLKEWFGLDSQLELDSSFALNNIVEKDRQKTIDAMNNALKTGSDGVYEMQHSVVNPIDGKERVILAKGKAFFDNENIAYRFSGIAQDVTDEVLFKKNQDIENNFNVRLLESNPDCVKIIDSNGKIIYMNENGVCVLEGDNKEFFLNREWKTMWEESESGVVNEAVEKAFQGETVNFQVPAYTVKGTLKWWDIIVVGLPNESGIVENLLAVSRDISGLKMIEKQLEEKEEILRFAVDGGDLGFFDTYPQKKELNWSDKTKKLYGLSPEIEVTWKLYESLIHPEDFETAQKNMFEALNNPKSDVYENEYRTNSENYRWLRICGKIKFDENGKAHRVTGIVQDITDKKLADIRINESERNFRMLADQAPIWIWLMDDDVNILFANPELLNFVGLKHYTEFTGKVWETIVHPDDIEVVYKNYHEGASQQKSFNFECRVKNAKKGNFEWIFVNVVARKKDNEFAGFIGTAINIHQQKMQMIALEESEERFRTLAESLPVLVWVTDKHGNAEYASGKWGEYAGKHSLNYEDWVHMVHPDDLENINKVWSHSLSTGDVYRYDVRLKSKMGEYRWFTVNGEPVFDAENKIVKWIGTFTDVQAEKSFSQELEKQVKQRTKELLIAKDNLTFKNDELEKMNKELESFAYVSSHDLQEPLRKIQTFSNRILEKEYDNLSEIGQEYLRRMRLAGERMQQLIQDLLAYSRTKTTDRKFESVNLDRVLIDIKDDLKDEIKQKNVVIDMDDTCSITVKIIPFQFRQLIYNLISNSIKFAKDDVQPVIKLVCEVAEGSEMSNKKLMPNQKYYHLKLSDNGIGFKTDYKDKIFEIFQRLHGREEYTGTGIGLAIVKKIVDNHNGFIEADGELGVGATFDIYIPTNL